VLAPLRAFLADPANLAKVEKIVVALDYYSKGSFIRAVPEYFPLEVPKWWTTLDELETWAVAGPKYVALHSSSQAPKFSVDPEINAKVSFWMGGDSSRLAADAIVNAANEALAPGGGICGVIHGAAGPQLAEECRQIGFTDTGKAAKTKGYDLIAKYVIHAVGPTRQDPNALKSAYAETLKYIDGVDIRSVGLCCISTGIFGYPIVPATHVALQTVRKFLENPENREKTDRIVFVVFERRDVQVYYGLAPVYFPLPKTGPDEEAGDPEAEHSADPGGDQAAPDSP
jgi:O-acetyl-ADP-ribose deacetylase (regulator of RNase III)